MLAERPPRAAVEHFQNALRLHDLPDGSVVQLVNEDGTVILGNIDGSDWVGRKVPEDGIAALRVASKEASAAVLWPDHVKRITGSAPVVSAKTASWRAIGLSLNRIGINLFPIQCRDPALLRDIEEALHTSSLPADILELEISETFALNNDDAIMQLQQLHSKGIKLSLGGTL
jgi:hypothetical protein